MNKNSLQVLQESTKNIKLLYVEDDPFTRDATTIFLNIFFQSITVAQDGQEALELFKENHYDLLISDIRMPKLDGFELTQRVRTINNKIPIVIISAHSEIDNFLTGIKLGIDGYLLKPIEKEQFFITIEKIIQQIELQNTLHQHQNNLEKMVLQKSQELQHRCVHEYYTDLPNSIVLHNDIESQNYHYMLLLDMSHFSTLNKEYGKDFANHIIVKTAQVLEHHITSRLKLYKTESDRFVILSKEQKQTTVVELCQQIVSFFDIKHITIDGIELPMTFNIGVSRIANKVHDTIIQCEYALDKSKELGSRHFEIYDIDDRDYQQERDAISWLKRTRELILEDKIEPYYQAIKNISKGEIYKYEVLARGIDNGEIIEPRYFISQAERLGLISSITKMIINKSFAFFSQNDLLFSINITERDLLENYLEDFFQDKLQTYKIDPARVSIEILENITLQKYDCKISEQLNRLKDIGFSISIDDFGVENSNFSRLLNIELDYIKLDGIYIRNLKLSERNRTITRAIVNLAKTLNIKTIAEFVEDEEIYSLVQECDIDYAQGYHIGKPQKGIL